MKSKPHRETEFLRHCLRYDENAKHQALDKKITHMQRDERCVGRAVWLMAGLTALTVAGLGYGVVLVDNFPYNTPQYIINIICALGLASMFCLVVFVGIRMVYRMKLDQRREECRQLVTRLLKSRLGQPVAVNPPGVVNEPGNVAPQNERFVSAPQMDLSRAR
jgi:hypothetical protein